MKLTKRMKNSIIQGMIVNLFFLLVLLLLIFFFLYPKFSGIEQKKEELLDTHSHLEKVTKQGIGFGDFKSTILKADFVKDEYTLNVMSDVSPEFYSEHFTNSGSSDYEVFLESLQNSIISRKTSEDYITKDQNLSSILPIYDEKNIFSDEGLSDFFFINHIENLLYSFNLSSRGEIGIGDLEKVDGSQGNITEEVTLQEDIYSISLLLEITGQKTDVVDFIHYFENVGSVSVTGDNFDIYTDSFISKVLEGEDSSVAYNIYQNQIADIQSLGLTDYLDSSSLKTQGLIEALKGEQSRERISIELELAFYVAGIPGYKMEKYIEDVLNKYQELLASISSDAKKYTLQTYKFSDGDELLAIKNLQSLDAIMLTLNDDISQLRIEIAKREDIERSYQSAIDYMGQISNIEESYTQQLFILTK